MFNTIFYGLYTPMTNWWNPWLLPQKYILYAATHILMHKIPGISQISLSPWTPGQKKNQNGTSLEIHLMANVFYMWALISDFILSKTCQYRFYWSHWQHLFIYLNNNYLFNFLVLIVNNSSMFAFIEWAPLKGFFSFKFLCDYTPVTSVVAQYCT